MKKVMLLVVGLFLGCGYYFLSYKKVELVTKAPQASKAKKMHKYRLNKLWRDKTVADLVERDGAIIDHYPLSDNDYRIQIGLKLKEEAAEVDEALQANNKKDLAEEIADVLEVLDCIIAFSDLDKQEIETIQAHKREKRGSFLDRDFVTDVQAVDGSYLHNYYLKSPDRHQEILD